MEHQNCRHLLYSLSDYVDGVAEQEICAEIERHLSGCDNCRIVVDSLRKTIYLYQVTNASPALPQDVRARLFHKLDLDEFLGK
jgi:predicted anti-sigma-YlaC factor YlaD